MPISTNGAAGAQGSAQSDPSASPTSPQSNSLSLAKWRKVQMADFLRLMKDNQRVLDSTLANNQTLNQQTLQLRAGQIQATGLAGQPASPAQPPAAQTEPDMSGMGDIKIDSPETHNHYYALEPPAPAQPPSPPTGPDAVSPAVSPAPAPANTAASRSWLPTILGILGSAGAAGLIGYLLHQTPTTLPVTTPTTVTVPAPTNTSIFNGLGLDLEQAQDSTGTAP